MKTKRFIFNFEIMECDYCGLVFNSKNHIRSHISQHLRTAGKAVLCHICNNNVFSVVTLCDHLECEHGVAINKTELSFNSLTEFNAWKSEEEKKNAVNFRLMNTQKRRDSVIIKRYICNRSGKKNIWRYDAVRSRRLKGSCKTGYWCACYIKLMVLNDNNLACTYQSTHTTHDLEVRYLRLPDDDKRNIYGKLKSGITPSSILDQMRQNLGCDVERKDLVTRKDIYNIAKKHGLLNHHQLHPNDAISVDMWVKNHDCNVNPVLFYKPQGLNVPPFREDDFMLVIMTETQSAMLKKCGEKVCIDTAQDTNESKFSLTTLVVIDEFGEGYPVAFCISSRIDELHMYDFFFKD